MKEQIKCDTGKLTFDTYKEGVEKLISLQKRKKKCKFSLYKCHLCGSYHICTTSKIKPVKKEKYKPFFKDIEHYHPPPKPKTKTHNSFKNNNFKPATQPLLNPQAAAALKQIIDAKNKN